jgi:hypothetical protein
MKDVQRMYAPSAKANVGLDSNLQLAPGQGFEP